MRPGPPLLQARTASLAPFVDAGVLDATAIHVADAIARAAGEVDDAVLLGAALAARAPLHGHVCVVLHDVATSVVTDDVGTVGDTGADARALLSWPDPDRWAEALRASPAVASPASAWPGEDPDHRIRPLVWDGTRLYLERYWRYEEQVAADLRRRAATSGGIAEGSQALDALLDALFGPVRSDEPDHQRTAAERALTHRLAVVAGGPGTGKTRTVARLLATALQLTGAGRPPLQVALAAPTGKAAARMADAVHREIDAAEVPEHIAAALRDTEATTVHRLIGLSGRRPPRRDHADPLPHDLVVIDETSMVGLPLMAHLLAAVRPDATLVLVGDPMQLASVEAGAVLGEIVGRGTPPSLTSLPSTTGTPPQAAARTATPSTGPTGAPPVTPTTAPLSTAPHGTPTGTPPTATAETPTDLPSTGPTGAPPTTPVVLLERVHRFAADSAIAALAGAIRAGDADGAVDLLRHAPAGELRWIDGDDRGAVDALLHHAAAAARAVIDDARAADATGGLAHLTDLKVLCAVRHGPTGVRHWTDRIQALATADLDRSGAGRWYVGRPVVVSANDYRNHLFNGDVGLTVPGDHQPVVAFDSGSGIRLLATSRLGDVETWWATTIHKSQGSEFGHVVVTLPPPPSPVLTRELLYTAITRARRQATIVATEASLRAAIARPVSRASGLGSKLWA